MKKNSPYYSLKLRFNSEIYDSFLGFLQDKEIHTFEEGEAIENKNGDLELINERSLITIRMEDKDVCLRLEEKISIQFPSVCISAYEHSDDYLNEWKKFSTPISISERIAIIPQWIEDNNETSAEIEIILDPGYAFGSGSHETTILCAQAIEKLAPKKQAQTLLDVGCGSGVLSVIAAKLGYQKVTGIDIDELAIEASYQNAIKNEIREISFSQSKLNEFENKYDVVVANIISSVLFELRADIKSRLKADGTLILSGILKEEVDEVVKIFELKNYTLLELNEWVAIVTCCDN